MKFWKITILAMCFATNTVFLHFRWEVSFFTVSLALVSFYLSLVAQGGLHEVGHYIGGKMSRHKLVLLQIGWVRLTCNRSGRHFFSFNKARCSQCIMLPSGKNPVRYKLYNAGGIIFNVLGTLSAFALLLVDSPIAALLLIEAVFAGGFKIVANLLPSIDDGVPTDGYVLRLLKKNPLIQKDYVKYLSLYAALFWEEKIRVADYNYERDVPNNACELLYYNGIRDLLKELSDGEVDSVLREKL